MIWLGGMNHRQRIGTAQMRNGSFYGTVQLAQLPILFLDQVRDNFGICLGSKDEALCSQLVTQLLIVLDDTVVDNGQPVAGHMGMSIRLRWLTMGRPAGMGNAEITR